LAPPVRHGTIEAFPLIPPARRHRGDVMPDQLSAPSVPTAATEFPVMGDHRSPTPFLDCGHAAVLDFARKAVAKLPANASDTDRAVALYYRVRDGIRYDPYSIKMAPEAFRASTVVADRAAFCIPKAILLAAAARALNIPALIGLADVKNHLTTPKLRALMGSDVFIHHGYTVLYLSGKWVKATPAFNIELCRKFGVLPLEFDGTRDSLMQPYDAKQQRHMEYLNDHGWFDDFPFERVMSDFRAAYPRLMTQRSEGSHFEEETPVAP
jgi:transglutaminase-like putative cysteine protease